MKKNIVFLFLLLNLFSFSQEKKIVKNGYITFNSNSIIEFENLVIENEDVTFFNKVSKTEMNFPLTSVKKIMNVSGVIIYESKSTVIKLDPSSQVKKDSLRTILVNKEVNEKLEYKSASKIYMNGEKLSSEKLEGLLKSESNIYNQYKKGKNGASLGNILLGGGIGLFIGGGINNMMQADSDSQGSPALLIIGIATSAIGIPVKLGGVKNLKEAINNYNSLPKKSVSFLEESELKFIASTNGIGFQFRF